MRGVMALLVLLPPVLDMSKPKPKSLLDAVIDPAILGYLIFQAWAMVHLFESLGWGLGGMGWHGFLCGLGAMLVGAGGVKAIKKAVRPPCWHPGSRMTWICGKASGKGCLCQFNFAA